MEQIAKKPKLVYFQWNHEASPDFIKLHMQLHAKCLAEFFDLVIINHDCDYQQVCDKHQPDLTLFESGYRTSISKKLSIKNTSAYPEIPKIGFHNGDPWCDCRVGFISDMEHWGIETFFSISTTMAEHTPEIAKNLFIWPNFIDSDIHYNYQQSKIVPILFNGSTSSLYPWRQKIFKLVTSRYPSMIFPHFGYESRSQMMIYGEQYARTINASWFVPACGAIAKEVVRKHFEVPGSYSCLITERTPSLEAAGFVDMKNCVFADEKDILDKLNYLFRNINELDKIISKGYELIHSRHTLKQRNQILQWFNLHKALGHNNKIIQPNPFEPLTIVETTSKEITNAVKCDGLHLKLLRKGDECLLNGKYNEAETFYFQCLNYIPYMREPKLKLAICNLHKANPEEALNQITDLNGSNFSSYKSLDPDPIEWSYLIISLLCNGKLNEAIIRANQFPALKHIELQRTRWVVKCLENYGEVKLLSKDALCKSRYSIHQIPPSTFEEWVNNLCKMLRACKQFSYAEALNNRIRSNDEPVSLGNNNVSFLRRCKKKMLSIRIVGIGKLNEAFEWLHVPVGRRGLPSIYIYDFLFRILKWLKVSVMKK